MDVLTPSAGVLTIDVAKDHAFEVNLTQNVTSVVINNLASYPGKVLELYFVQDSTGSRTVGGWPSSVKLAGNALTLTTAAGKRDTVCFRRLFSSAVLVETARSMNAPA